MNATGEGGAMEVASPGGWRAKLFGVDTKARNVTIDSNANVPYPLGTQLTIVNQYSAGVVTIKLTSDTIRLAGAGSTGDRTLAANGIAIATKLTATEWIIDGTGLT